MAQNLPVEIPEVFPELSPSQQRAISCGDGPALVLAGPGSGKTTVVTRRILHLIRNRMAEPGQILVITFSKQASAEMRRRYLTLAGEQQTKPGVVFGTFHAVFFQILKQAYHLDASSIIREEQRNSLLETLAEAEGLDIRKERDILQSVSAEISMIRTERIDPEHYYSTGCNAAAFRNIFRGYQEEKRKQHLVDFDDMLVLCYELLTARSDILQAWQKRFRYILVDEFQDINQLQYETVRLLAQPENNLFAVGDDDQSIYRFRGARPEIMLGFSDDYPDAAILRLEENFRSRPEIISVSGKVIARNTNRFEKQIRAVREDLPETRFEIRAFGNPPKETEELIRHIRSAFLKGTPYREMAVLTRTRSGSRYFAEQFLRSQIPFEMQELSWTIYDHWIAGDIDSYLSLASGDMNRKDFLRIMNHPVRYLSRSCVDREQISFDRLRYYYEEQGWMMERIDRMEEDLKRMGSLTPFAAINYLRKAAGYDDFVREYASERGFDGEELIQILEELQEGASGCASVKEWNAYTEKNREALRMQMARQKQEAANPSAEKRDAVWLGTLHAAKGLEFDEVFLPDVNEGILPWRKARLSSDREEERRLLYVGMTRARERLHIFYLKERYGKTLKPSSFLVPLMPKD